MRNKLTNLLQVCILITGLVYALTGFLFFMNPTMFGRLLSIQVTDEWINQIKMDEFLVLLYLVSRSLSALLITTGLSMVLPLYEPLKYRGVIYFSGVLYPLLMAIFLLKNGYVNGYHAATYVGFVFLSVFVINFIGLYLTKRNADKGIE